MRRVAAIGLALVVGGMVVWQFGGRRRPGATVPAPALATGSDGRPAAAVGASGTALVGTPGHRSRVETPPRLRTPPPAEKPRPPLMTVDQVYEANPKLIPSFHDLSVAKMEDPEAGARELKAWRRCGWEYAERAGLPHQGVVRITLGYTLAASNGTAVLEDLERMEGGDDELAACLDQARPWMRQPFAAAEARDGTFRWEGPSYAIPLGDQPLRPFAANEAAPGAM